MSTRTIDGGCCVQMLYGGAAQLAAHAEELNALNVFPVSDGDTGTNMTKTMEGGLAEAAADPAGSIGAMAGQFARGTLLAARGNSGVILSQIIAGIAEGLADCDTADARKLAEAYKNGIARSYAAVQNPTEGTILTVFRESTEYAAANINENSSVEDFFRLHIEEARRSLAATKERLPVLAEADVVDSGAAGYLCIAEGMYERLTGKVQSGTYLVAEKAEKGAVNIDLFTRDSVLEYGYCTEFLLRLTTAKVDPDAFDIQTVLSDLRELGGESVVAYKQGDIVKVHVHTFTPGEILARMQSYGEFLTVKVENMSLGHAETPKRKNSKAFSVVAVAPGPGIGALFTQMGADQIIAGGQTSNPSIEEFLEAFRRCDTESIIVLPNNKNVILAAKQAAQLYTGAAVHIVETKNVAQGYGALGVITPGITDMQALVGSAVRAAESVTDGEITRAVRDAVVDGVAIRQGDYLAISGGTVAATADSAEEAVLKLLNVADTELAEIITLFAGRNVTNDQRAALTERLKECCPDCEITVYEGGQEVYDYIVGIE